MTAQDRVRWDAYYRERKQQPFPQPDPLLLQWTPPVPSGAVRRAMDGAAGLGQNGLWLAEQGYITDIMEVSRVALSRTRAEVTLRNIRNVNLLQQDFDDMDLDEQVYDLLCVFRYLKRGLMHKLKSAVIPGGRLIYETYNRRYLDIVPAFNPDFLLEDGELNAIFSDWTILYSTDETHISQIVAIKPDAHAQKTNDTLDW
jgi:tellurite methyltransferase